MQNYTIKIHQKIIRLQNTIKREIVKSRQHFLQLSLPKTYRKLIAQGLISNCNKEEILDTKKNKCISRNSPEGRKILSNIGLTESKSLLDKYYKQQKKLNSQVEIRVQEVEATLDMCQLKNREINTKIIDIKTQKKEVNKEYNEKNKELNKQLKN